MKTATISSLLILACCGLFTGCASQPTYGPSKGGVADYNLGRSDAVRQQYWMIQNQQKNLQPKPQPRVSLYPVTTGGTTTNGITTVPTTEYIRIED